MINQTSYPPIHQLRKRMTELVRSIRKSTITPDTNLSVPISDMDDEIILNNQTLKRKRIVLLTSGCTVASCTMCPLPNEAIDPNLRCIKETNIIEQFDGSFRVKKIDDYDVVTIYTNGNFFVDQEVSPKARQHIYQQISKSRAKILIVESLPQFITKDIITEAQTHLGDKQLSVSIGLQSSDDLVRELAINSTTTKQAFEQAIDLLHKANYRYAAFLMVKPPFLTEQEAITDAVNSVKYLNDLDILDPMLCATKVGPNTVVDLLAKDGKFSPPWLWTVIEILRQLQTIAPTSKPIIATSLLQHDRNVNFACPQNCNKCSQPILDAMQTYNMTRNLEPLLQIHCDCYNDYQKAMIQEQKELGELPLIERIINFLDDHEK